MKTKAGTYLIRIILTSGDGDETKVYTLPVFVKEEDIIVPEEEIPDEQEFNPNNLLPVESKNPAQPKNQNAI